MIMVHGHMTRQTGKQRKDDGLQARSSQRADINLFLFNENRLCLGTFVPFSKPNRPLTLFFKYLPCTVAQKLGHFKTHVLNHAEDSFCRIPVTPEDWLDLGQFLFFCLAKSGAQVWTFSAECDRSHFHLLKVVR